MILCTLLALTLPHIPNCCQTMQQMAADPKFVALHEAPIQTEFTPKYGKMGRVAGADAFIVPASKGSGGGVIMIHEWWGLNNQIKSTAEKLHEDTGFGVVAVDLYGGKVATKPDEAAQLMRSVDAAKSSAQLRDTVAAIRYDKLLGSGIKRVGTIGYCFGGGWSLQTALDNGREVNACVMYYGAPPKNSADLNNLQAPLLGFFGTQDTFLTPAVVDKFKADLKEAGKSYSIFSYDAPHAFANPSNPHFNKEATEDSWAKTIAFFKKHLG